MTGPRLRGRPTLRFLDRYAGIPVVALLGLLKGQREMPKDIRRIGVLRTAAIGEVLLISAILTDLRKHFPSDDIVMITGEGNSEMGELVCRGGRARHLEIAVARPFESAATLRREKFDVLIDTGPWPRFDAILTALSGARFTIGFSSTGHARHFAYDLVIPHARDVHELENFRSLIRPLGVPTGSLPSLDVPGSPLAPHTSLPTPAGPRIVFHPWSGGFRAYLREWPDDRWVELAKRLANHEATILISGGPGDRAKSEKLATALQNGGVKAASVAGLSMTEMIPVLRSSLLVVGVNTSVTHLASILETPTVMLHGPTSHKRWGPLGPNSVSVESSYPNCGYVHHGFEFEGQREDCMQGVAVEAVRTAAIKAVATAAARLGPVSS